MCMFIVMDTGDDVCGLGLENKWEKGEQEQDKKRFILALHHFPFFSISVPCFTAFFKNLTIM